MKNLKAAFICIILLALANAVLAQTLSEPTHNSNNRYKYPERNSIVSLYPLAFGSGDFKIGFEQRLGEASTIKIMPSLGYADHSNYYQIDNYFGFSVEGMLKYFPMRQSPNGFYGSIYAFYKYAQGDNYYSGSVTAGGGGVCFGGQFNIKNVFFVDMYIGGGPVIPSSKYFFPDHSNVGLLGNSGQLPGFSGGIGGHAGISLGIPLR